MSNNKDDNDDVLCDNNLYFQRGDRVVGVALPPLHDALEVRRVPAGHPAWPGRGVYVKRGMRIAKDEQLGLYAGVYRLTELADTTPCTFGLDTVPYCVDAQYEGNALRYVNDPTGIAPRANLRAEETWVSAGTRNLMTVAYFAVEDIESDTELTLPYGPHYNMTMRLQPWRSELPAPTANQGQSSEDEEEEQDEIDTEFIRETPKEHGRRLRSEFAECGAGLVRLSQLSHYFTGASDLCNIVHYWTLVGLGRKLARLGVLSTDEMSEANALCQFVRPLEDTMRCSGPCQRVRKVHHFGQPEMDIRFNFKWPHCDDCLEGHLVAVVPDPKKRRRIGQDNAIC